MQKKLHDQKSKAQTNITKQTTSAKIPNTDKRKNTQTSIAEKFLQLQNYFSQNSTKPFAFRLQQLKKLQTAIEERQEQLAEALYKDLHKSPLESYMVEVGVILDELRYSIKHLKKWMHSQNVKTPLAHFWAKSFITPEPYGVVLIVSPWNYPFQLTLSPLIGAIAAGNCVVIKPSDDSPNMSKALYELIDSIFDKNYITVIEGGIKESEELLKQNFDYIFFTGSPAVGKIVMRSAAEHLTPVTLELGGKSPCIVEQSANLKITARRIAFGKLLNSGQTCVSPDYVLVDEKIKAEFIKFLIAEIDSMLPTQKYRDENLPSIVNQRHFTRLKNLLKKQKIVYGGKINVSKKIIEPTLVDEPAWEDALMQEEIFGPILPILSYRSLDGAVQKIKSQPKPLALYLFTTSAKIEKKILSEVSYGGGCINDTIVHLANPDLPFGGVGNSGMGNYRGKTTFETFSHYKSVLKKYNWPDVPVRYHPFNKTKEKFLRFFLK